VKIGSIFAIEALDAVWSGQDYTIPHLRQSNYSKPFMQGTLTSVAMTEPIVGQAFLPVFFFPAAATWLSFLRVLKKHPRISTPATLALAAWSDGR
jgi:hypothetical protein